ncbi:MAG: SWIM zinc finger family protein [Anaerolineales bacterium]|nr:SWIM zinc finger family protein [Anaerolineales bacterium]
MSQDERAPGSPQAGRTDRARQALERGELIVTALAAGAWEVRNGESGPYTITRAPDWACTCPDFTQTCAKQGLLCKHIEAVRLTIEPKDAAPTTGPKPQPAGPTLESLVQRLRAPFPASQVSWKPQTISKDKARAMAVAYIDARDVMDRLDEVVGAFNWQVEHREAAGQLITGLGLRHPQDGQWRWKWDVGFVGGSDSDNDDEQMKAVKGTASDGLKRAAVLWGVGRYLYSLPKQWLDWDADKRQFKQAPVLPKWAVPAGPGLESALKDRGAATTTAPAAKNGKNGSAPAAEPAAQPGMPRTLDEAKAVVCTLGASDRPDFRGQTFGQLMATPAGQKFVTRIAREWTPDAGRPDGQTLKQAAELLIAQAR